MAKSAWVPFTGLWLTARRETLIDRVAARLGDPSDADRGVVERQLDYDVGELGDWLHLGAEGSQMKFWQGRSP